MKLLARWRAAWPDVLVPLAGAGLALLVMLRSLIFTPGYVIYRDLFPGQLYYPSIWNPEGSFLALENYKFATFTGLFLPLRGLGLDVYEKAVYASAFAVAYLAAYVLVYRLLGHLTAAGRGGEGGGEPRGMGTVLRKDRAEREGHFPPDKSGSPAHRPDSRTCSGSDETGGYVPWVRRAAALLAALTYVANPAAANVFFDFSLFVGYAFAPLILLLYVEMLQEKRRRGVAIVLIAVLWWISAIKAHWIIFGALLLGTALLVWTLFEGRRAGRRAVVRNWGATGAIGATYLCLSAYWLVPFVLASRTRFVGSYAPITFEAVAYLSNTPFLDTVRLLGLFPAWPYVRFDPPAGIMVLPWTLASWLIPALAVLAVVRFRRHWQIWLLVVFTVSGVFLAKGVAPPLGSLYNWLVFGELTPTAFRWLFRVASKWNVFVSLGYSALVGVALAELLAAVRIRRLWRASGDTRAWAGLLAVVGYGVGLVWFAWPSFSGDFGGALVPVRLPEPLSAANRWLADQEGDFKVNWMPVMNGREASWNPRPSGDLYTSLSSRPSIATNWNRHPVLYYSYAYDAVANERTANLGKLLSPLNTQVVMYHGDVVSAHIHEGVEPVAVLIEEGERNLPEQLNTQQDLRLVWQDGFVSAFETREQVPPLFVPERAFLAAGDLPLLTSLSALESYRPAEEAVVFDASLAPGAPQITFDGLLLGRDAANRLAFSLISPSWLLAPADATRHGSVADAWSRFDIYQFDWQAVLRDQGLYGQWGFDYEQGVVAHVQTDAAGSSSESSSILEVPAEVPVSGAFELWVRHLSHPRAGVLRVSFDGMPLAVWPGEEKPAGFVWRRAGTLQLTAGRHVIGLENRDGFNAVNALALVPESEMAHLRGRAQELAAGIPNIYLLEAESDWIFNGAEMARPSLALSGGRAVALVQHAAITTTLDLVAPGDYTVGLRAASTGSSVPLTVTIGLTDLSLLPRAGEGDLEWLVAEPVSLSAGPLPIRVQAGGPVVLDMLMLYSGAGDVTPESFFGNADPPAQISFQRVDPTRYRVWVNARRPYVLALAESYDPLWVASGVDFQVTSTPLYGVINGFSITRVGSYALTVEYLPQQWARLGAMLSLAMLICLGLGLLVTTIGSRYARHGRHLVPR